MSLPPGDSPDLDLVVATAEELLAQQHVNSSEWRGALSLDAYLRREEHLFQQDLTKNGGLTPWLLVHQPAGTPDQDRVVLCGCETIKKRALVSANREVRDVVAHGVASVFCPAKYRGKGYAGRMIAELGERLKTWQNDERPSLFSVLYSDIGKVGSPRSLMFLFSLRSRSFPAQDFYAARGWHPFRSSHISLDATKTPPSTSTAVQLLKASDLAPLCEADESFLKTHLAQSQKPTIALAPDAATLAWHHAREEFVAKELFHRDPQVKGAIVGSEPGKRAWCIWTRVWTNPNEDDGNTLHILRLVVEDGLTSEPNDFTPATEDGVARVKDSPAASAVAALFAEAQRQAAEWDMEVVEFWNPNAVALAAARRLDDGAMVHEREKASICSMRWYGEGDGRDVDWVCSEKYAWC